MSLLVFLATGAISIFFIQVFFNRNESSIISYFKTSNDSYIENFHNFPFMIKLSYPGAVKLTNPEQTWRLNPYLYTMDPKISSSFNLTKVNYSRCTKDRFKGYDNILSTIENLEEYFCFDFGNKKFDLAGPYGGSGFNQFLNIRIRGCYEEIEKTKCLSPAEVQTITKDLFLDIRVLNTNIVHENINPIEKEMLGQRIPISNTVLKRIYFQMQTVDYTSDFGYVFQSQETLTSNQFNDYTVDSSLIQYNDVSNTAYYKVFTILNLVNSQSKMFYNRTYMKAQTLLANIGGILKGITFIAQVLNYFISNRLLDLELSNLIHLKLQKVVCEDNESIFKQIMKNNQKEEIKKSTPQVRVFDNLNTISKNSDSKQMSLRIHELIIPLGCFCNKEKKNRFETSLKIANSILSIANLLQKLQELEGLKRCVLSSDELKTFNSTFKKIKKEDKENVSKFVSNFTKNIDNASNVRIKGKDDKNLFNDFLEKVNS